MRLKDVIALGILSLLSFPLVLLGILVGMGKIHMSFGDAPLSPEAKARMAEHVEAGVKPAESAVKAGASTDEREAEIDRREAQVLEEQKRLEALREDVTRSRDSIAKERERMERLFGKTDSLEALRVKALAATFSNMKADDAAKILAGMDDLMATSVLRAIPEDKSRAKILAAIGRTSDARAAQLAKYLGTARGAKAAEAAKEPKEAKEAPAAHKEEKKGEAKPAAAAHPPAATEKTK